MSPTFTRKGQRRYRYYVSQALLQCKDKDAGSIRRIPALEIETPVLNKLEHLFSSATEVLALIPEGLSPNQIADLANPLEQLRHDLRSPSPQPKIILLKTLIKTITLGRQAMTITLAMAGLRRLLGITPDNTDSAFADEAGANDTKTWVLQLSLRRYGREVKVMLGDRLTPLPQPHSMLVQGLQRALKKALIWNNNLLAGKSASLARIAEEEKVTQRYIAQMIRLAYLAPDIQEAIIKGKIPPTWTVDQFREAIPLSWEQQRLKFRLRHAS
jgi:site-specific DNA recombinase